MPKIKAIIFDLDDTLYDCTGMLLDGARRRAADAMVEAGLPGSAREAYQMQVDLAEQRGPNYLVFDEIARRHGLDRGFVAAALRAYNSEEVGDIELFGDVGPTLERLRLAGYRLFLVTTGLYARQEHKVEALGLRRYFTDVIINDLERGTPLEDCYRDLLTRYHLRPTEVAVVGDRVLEELDLGHRLGMTTVQMCHGRFRDERMVDGGVHPVVHAAAVAYGFVFLHPFEDGNGRIHRFLIHNILARSGFTPEGVMVPVSAAMLRSPAEYDASLEALSRPLMPLLDYSLD